MGNGTDNVKKRFILLQRQALFGIFIGYVCYYLIRNNFVLSSPYLVSEVGLSKTQIGFISSVMYIAYGMSKGVWSILADKGSPRYFYTFGLLACIVINFMIGFSTSFYLFVFLIFLLGIFQGTGAGPALVVIGYWFSRKQRARASTLWNISHNIGGGLVAPVVGVSTAYLGTEHWRIAIFAVPAALAIIGVICSYVYIKERPYELGLPPVDEVFPETISDTHEGGGLKTKKAPENMSSFAIFKNYVLKSPHAWYLVGVDIFTYMVRFGTITWIPLYLMSAKGFSKMEMSTAFAFFEFAAIPSTVIAGYLVDKYFVGKVMKLPIFCFIIIALSVIGYTHSDTILMVTIFASIIGCLVYIPQSMTGVQAMETIPSFALGSAVGLRGFMAYIVGSSLGTTLFGFLVDNFGWDSGFYAILVGTIFGMLFCSLSHLQRKKVKL
ncbi:MFS transporter [Escherichia coli]|uniref:MFS transporter n=1 Tax=Escherichia coli TaxID=562 RepID=UPI001EFED52E|nr:MFS transporter [Escherichia coli]MCG9399756.1 MFS transporter [Escherichia coli]MCG9456825.1 MFS transporter [Escherichia coli]